MSCPSLKTIFIVLVTSVAANHEGALCDCASQGPWQPLFKPSQILHSEFPEHQHSSSTGGPKANKFRTINIVPHLVVPLVNPLAIAIHHDNRHTTKDNSNLYGDDDRHHDQYQNSLDESHHVKEKPVKEIHYHHSYPYSKDPYPKDSYPKDPYPKDHYPKDSYPKDPYPKDPYPKDSYTKDPYPTDSYPKDPYDDNKYNEPPSNTQTGPDDNRDIPHEGGGNNDHNHLDAYPDHHDNDQNTHYNQDISSENANLGSQEAHHNEPISGIGTTGSGPTGIGTSTFGDNSQEHYNPEEGSTAFPYYNSEEQKDHIYDSSKYTPAYEVKDHAAYNDIRGDPYYYNHHYYNDNTVKNNDIGANGQNRGKSLRYPTMIDGDKYSDDKYVRNSVSSSLPRYKIIGKSKGSSLNSQKANSAVPPSLHSDLYHPPPPPPPHAPLPPSTSKPLLHSPNRAPIYHHPPFAAILSPWKFLIREEAKRMTILRPPAPGLVDTWTADMSTQRSNDFPLMKKPRVLYVMKTIPK